MNVQLAQTQVGRDVGIAPYKTNRQWVQIVYHAFVVLQIGYRGSKNLHESDFQGIIEADKVGDIFDSAISPTD